MKRIVLFVALFSMLSISMAQTSGGPDAFGYTWKANTHPVNPPIQSWFDIATIGTQVTGLSDDNVVGPFNITNGFTYYWYNPTKFWIGSNGYISFDGDNIASPFPTGIPLSTGANNYIAGLLSDLNFSGSGNPGKCYYYGNSDTVCVSFVEVPYWYSLTPGYTGQNSFQIILSRIDSSVTINYISTILGNQTTIDNIVGIENITGTIGIAPYVDSIPPDTFTVKFYYPPSTTYQAVDGGVNWIDNEQSGGVFVKKDALPTPLRSNVKNYGNTNLASFTVRDTVFDDSGNPVVGGSASSGALSAGDDITVTFSDSLELSSSGTFVNRTYVNGIPGDLVASNNTYDQEIIAVDTSGPMILDYSDGMPDGGLAWNGGNTGIAVYIEPPIYPAKVLNSQFYINFNTTPAQGFHAIIYDDDGPNGGHGTVLDSVFVVGNTITTGQYTNVDHTSANVVIDSGGLYLLWYMGGANIQLGRDINQPISRRSIEVIAGGWGGYRDLLTEDFLMGVKVDYAWPRAAFTALTGFDPQINFVDMSTNDPSTWYWTFGDGDTSSAQNPSHDYLENGTYQVCLAVSNAYGSDTVCDSVEVKKVLPTAFFTYNDSAFPQIAFKDESTGPPTSWQWNLADTAGPVVGVQNPIYTFKNNGIRNVCLTAINANGSSAPYCEAIEIYGIGLAEFGLEELRVIPNPMSEFARIVIPKNYNGTSLRLRAINISGQGFYLVHSLKGNEIVIQRNGISKGQYLVEVLEGKSIRAFFKLTVE
ncbi:MAG: PKD domain-containing protein [Vicingaceae bacterium]